MLFSSEFLNATSPFYNNFQILQVAKKQPFNICEGLVWLQIFFRCLVRLMGDATFSKSLYLNRNCSLKYGLHLNWLSACPSFRSWQLVPSGRSRHWVIPREFGRNQSDGWYFLQVKVWVTQTMANFCPSLHCWENPGWLASSLKSCFVRVSVDNIQRSSVPSCLTERIETQRSP